MNLNKKGNNIYGVPVFDLLESTLLMMLEKCTMNLTGSSGMCGRVISLMLGPETKCIESHKISYSIICQMRLSYSGLILAVI